MGFSILISIIDAIASLIWATYIIIELVNIATGESNSTFTSILWRGLIVADVCFIAMVLSAIVQ